MKRSLFQRHSLVLVVYGMILFLMFIGAMNSERFLSIRNLTNVLRQAAYLGTAALGEMLVILTAGIDLSIGSLVKLCVLVSAILMDGNPDNVWMAVILTLGLGLLAAALMEVGYRGAEDALRAYHSVKELRPLELGVLSDGFELPYRPLADRAEAEAQFKAAAPDKDQYGRGMCEYRHWQAVLQTHDTEAVSGRRYEQVLTRLGPLALVPFPGEPFVEIVLRLRDLSPFQYTLCASTSCGNNGYLVTRESLHRGGYEVWVTKAVGPYILAEHIDDVLVQENLALLRRLVGG